LGLITAHLCISFFVVVIVAISASGF